MAKLPGHERFRGLNAPPSPLGTQGDPALRHVGAARVIDELLQSCFAFEVAAGQRAAAEAECTEALARWRAAGLPVGSTATGAPGYNPLEVHNFMVWSGRLGADPFWRRFHVTTARRLVRQLATAPPMVPPGNHAVTLVRRFNLAGLPAGTPLRPRLPLPLALEPGALRLLGAWPAPPRQAPGRLLCQLVTSGAASVELGWQASFPAHGSPDPAPPDAAARLLYTQPREGLVQVSPRVAALAGQLAAGAPTALARVMALWRWVNANLLVGKVPYHELDTDQPMDWLLDHGWMDCQLGAALLVSLARALGLPARLLGGHFLYPLSPDVHFWAEIWLEDAGWTPFDLLSWGLSAGGQDEAWRDHFAGRLEARLTTQVMPRQVTGPLGVALPPRWYVATVARPAGGIAISLENAATGAVVHTDVVSAGPASLPAPP